MNTLYKYVALAVFTAGPLAAQSSVQLVQRGPSAIDKIALLPVVDGKAVKTPKISLETAQTCAEGFAKERLYSRPVRRRTGWNMGYGGYP